jgi:RNA polymerase sigma-70 factor (ECF subfamily)
MDEDWEALAEGGEAALADRFSRFRNQLSRMVRFRLDPRLRSRLDPSDVLQEAWVKMARRLPEVRGAPTVSFYVWARRITWQTLIDLQRVGMGQRRDPRREVGGRVHAGADATSLSILRALVGDLTPPSAAAVREERSRRLNEALASMDELDREVLALRHFEQLGNKETAEVLGLSETAASNRYVRALGRLGDLLAGDQAPGDGP